MIMKRKLCLGAVLFGILFFMIATHTIQKDAISSSYMVVSPATKGRTTIQTPTLPPTNTKPVPVPGREGTCSCKTCVADAGKSEWFDQLFDREQQPYLINGEYKMDRVSWDWWLGLQRSVYDDTLEEVIHKMFTVFSSPLGELARQKNHCRSCAVVGNSGNLLGSRHGADIDSNKIVIRMNKAITQGYEANVGNRTTHHIIYPESAVDLSPGVHLVLLPFKLLDMQWLTSALSTGEITRTYMRVKNLVSADKDKVMVINPMFIKYTHEKWNMKHGRYPSTGMLAIIFALHLCDEVSVFGYGADEQGNWHHYWENNKHGGAFRKTGVHNGDFEMKIIHELDKAGKIRLYER